MVLSAPVCCSPLSSPVLTPAALCFFFSWWPKKEQKLPKAFYFYLVVQCFMMPKELFIEHVIFSSAVQGATLLDKVKFVAYKIRPATPFLPKHEFL